MTNSCQKAPGFSAWRQGANNEILFENTLRHG